MPHNGARSLAAALKQRANLAGLGGGLDQAEEAQLGVTDEDIDEAIREELGLERDK